MTRRVFVLMVLLALPAVAAPVPKALKKKADAELLVGRWEGVTLDTGGGPGPATTWYIEFRDGKLSTGDAGGKGYVERAYKIDPDASPKQLDIDAGNGQFILNIYELDGDTLKWCESASTTKRPAEMKAGDGFNLFVFKRPAVK
jgi:uncharacterized protein (TIGR03067 family)